MRVFLEARLPIKCWATELDEATLEQAFNLANHPFAMFHIALMPDAHMGYGMPIGGVLATQGVVIPNAVGVDISCGMIAVRTSLTEIEVADLKTVMGLIRKTVPVGFAHHKRPQDWSGFDLAPSVPIIQQQLESAQCQLGTLGGGNHFIEIQQGADGHVWGMVHSGSRNFGLQVATVYHKKAMQLCERWASAIPDKDLAFLPLDTIEGQEYIDAMNYCMEFAKANRRLMMDNILEALAEVTGATADYSLDVHHNYAAMENYFGRNVLVHRKGAIRARAGERGIIPGSMGSPSYIVEGLGNPDSFYSSSHGAGRRMGRKQAQRELVLADEQAKLQGVVHGLRNVSDLDEAVGAYKDIDEVMDNQSDLTAIVTQLSPLANIKG